MRHTAIRSSVILAAVLAATTAVAAPRSIVGQWRLQNAQCTVTDGAMSIAPMAVVWDEFACEFTSVKRSGSTVTWRGQCTGSDGGPTKATVVARERAGVLSVSVNGNRDSNGDYVRCDAAVPSDVVPVIAKTAAGIPVVYREVDVGSAEAKRLWGDTLDPVLSTASTGVLIADVGGFTVSTIVGGSYCGTQCPVRIMKGGTRVVEESACANVSMHVLHPGRKPDVDCGETK